MVRHFITLLLALFTIGIHAQSFTQSVKDHIMGMTVVSAKEMTNEIASNRIRLNKHFDQIKEKGSHPFILIRGEIKELSELDTGCIITIRGDFFEELNL